MHARILVDGPAASEMAAALDAVLGHSMAGGWLVSVVHVGHPWWCLNVLASPEERLAGWSHVATRSDLPRLLKEALAL